MRPIILPSISKFARRFFVDICQLFVSFGKDFEDFKLLRR